MKQLSPDEKRASSGGILLGKTLLAFWCFFFVLAFTCVPHAADLEGSGVRGNDTVKDEEKIDVDFKDVELADLIRTFSELTGKNFLFDERVRGKATIISSQRVSRDEAYQVFLSVLHVKGYTVVPSGRFNKIVALNSAKENSLPMVAGNLSEIAGERYITQLIRLEYIDASDIAGSVLAPLVPKTGNITAYPPANSLIITDSAANIERLLGIIKQLDLPGSKGRFEVITLKHVNAKEMAQLLDEVLGRSSSAVERKRRGKVISAEDSQAKVIPFYTSNVLVVQAATDEMEQIRFLVEQLDLAPAQNRATIHVYPLENADAETLAKTLNEILNGFGKGNGHSAAKTRGQEPGQQSATDRFGSVNITHDKPTNSLLISSIPEEYVVLRGIIEKLDIKRKQVYVEALILELSMDATEKIGASLQGAFEARTDGIIFAKSGLNTENLSVNSENPLASAINGILLGGIFNPITVTGPDGSLLTVPALSALIDLSKSDTGINILSAPRLLTSDNEEAEIVVGANVPIITSRLTNAVGTATTGSSGMATSVAVERKDVALTLRFTPQIISGDLVRLNVYQEITNVAESNANVGNPDQVGPTFTKRLIKNTVVSENRQTVVLGGLIGSNVSERVTKVPLLGDIPVLGWLFKSKNTVESKTNLLVFITPYILKDSSDLAAVTGQARNAMDDFQSHGTENDDNASAVIERFMPNGFDNQAGKMMQ